MKKLLKFIGITVLLHIVMFLIAAVIAIWIVFTPERLTSVVRDQLPKFVTCETSLEKVDLTFFSTFPSFGLHIKNLCLKNPMPESPSDTVIFVEDCTATIKLDAFLRNEEVILEKFYLRHLFANLYTDTLGASNFDVFVTKEDNDTTPFKMPFDIIQLKKINISDVTAFYTDRQAKISAAAHNLNLNINGGIDNDNGDLRALVELGNMEFSMNDSTPMAANLENLELIIDGEKIGNNVKGAITLLLPNSSFTMDKTDYLKSANVLLAVPFSADLETKELTLDKAKIALNDYTITFSGQAAYKANKDIALNLDFATNTWNIKQLLKLVPSTFTSSLKAISVDGNATITGTATGIYNDSLLPNIAARVNLTKGTFAYAELPYTFRNVALTTTANLNLNKGELSSAHIEKLSAQTGGSSFNLSGKIDDVLDKMYCDLQLKADLNLPDIKPLLPADMKADIQGRTTAAITGKFALNDAVNLNLNKIRANIALNFTNLDAIYDSLSAKTPSARLNISLPSAIDTKKIPSILSAKLASPDLTVKMIDGFNAHLQDADIDMAIGNFMDTSKLISAVCAFDMQRLTANLDTIDIDVTQPKGEITLSPSRRNPKHPRLQLTYNSQNLSAKMGSFLQMKTNAIKISATTTYDETQENLYLRFNPRLNVDFSEGNLQLASIKPTIHIPIVKFDFTPRQLNISDSHIIIEDSDFKLTGLATNIRKFITGKDLLKGEFDFVSGMTNVNQLLDLISGFGNDSAAITATDINETPAEKEADPFMVPKGVDLTLNTKIENALYNNNLIQNVGGTLTIKDGVAILEQMGFTCDAAQMQLTAMYRSDRRNHLFTGINFHLLNIDIKQLIHMIPSIDTIIPMLKSFEGKAQFHLSAETYLKANYDLKLSTLRGAAAIEGKDLVLMDSETFSKIAKTLLFSRKTKNLVDSLSVEMTVYKNEVDLYPFVISMGNYSAVVAGRYDLSQNYNAHIETLSPIRLALKIRGNTSDFDNMKFDLVPTKYSNLYKPEKRNVNQEYVMSLKRLISGSLKRTVK